MGKQDLRAPHLPPVLQSRAGNEFYDRPQTPAHHGFTTPIHTPQGSPSKNRFPPGATELPDVFENAMKLTPSSPTKSVLNAPSLSPGREQGFPVDGRFGFNQSVIHNNNVEAPVSPSRKANKENAAPGTLPRRVKDFGCNPSYAATSRQEPYQLRDRTETSGRRQHNHNRGLTAEEQEKLQLPNVKRLANVTQLCKFSAVCRSVILSADFVLPRLSRSLL